MDSDPPHAIRSCNLFIEEQMTRTVSDRYKKALE